MTTHGMFINCRWGGTIVRDDDGVSYVGGQAVGFTLTPTTTYKGLRRFLCSLVGINSQVHKVCLICRYPCFDGSKWMYKRLLVNSDEKVTMMCNARREHNWLTSLDMYVLMAERGDITTTVSQPVIVQSETLTPPTQYGDSHYQPQQDFHPDPLYNNANVNNPLYSGSYLQPSSSTSLQPPTNTYLQPSTMTSFPSYYHEFSGQQSQTDYSNISFGGESSQMAQNQHQLVTVAQHSTCVDAIAPTNTMNTALALANSNIGHEEEIVNEDEVIADDGDDDVNAELSEEDEAADDFEPPSTYFTDTSGFQDNVQWEPKGLVHTSAYDPKSQVPRKGLIFETKQSLQDAISKYSIYKNFHYRVAGSNKSMWELRCKHDDYTHCAWRLRGSLKKNGFWEVATYHGPHTCVRKKFLKCHPQLTAALIARTITHLVKVDPAYKIVTIKAGVFTEFKVHISYYKAWYAKQIAITHNFGDWNSSYADLPRFLIAVQEANPGTIVEWDTIDLRNREQVMFDRIFWAFKPCIDGFEHCRPLVSIDATFLYGKYSGNLLIAMSKDGADKLFPLAFAIVEKENRTNWGWFLRLLRKHVAKERMNLCIIADRHKGILAAIDDDRNGWGTTHSVHHRYCLRHVQANFYKKFANSTLKQLLWEAGTQTDIAAFEEKMDKIRETDQTAGKAAWHWINALPIQKWALAYDEGRRYGEMTTNISESFNGVLRAARFLPLTACAQVIFFRVVALFYENTDAATAALAEGAEMTPFGIIRLQNVIERSTGMAVSMFNRVRGEAIVSNVHCKQFAVHLQNRKCSCGMWTAYHFPCEHAMKVCHSINMDESVILPNWCSMDTYALTWGGGFHPVLNKSYWAPWTRPTWIPNPELLRGKGRRRESRIENEMDRPTNPREVRCCRSCGKEGHNKKTCPTKVDDRPFEIQFAQGFQDY